MEKRTILQLMDILAEKSENSGLGEAFLEEYHNESEELASILDITPLQAVLLSVFLQKRPRGVGYEDLAIHLGISHIKALGLSGEIEALVKRQYLKCLNAKDGEPYYIPTTVVNAFKENVKPVPSKRTGLTFYELFESMEQLYNDVEKGAITPDMLFLDLKLLFADNSHLEFVRELEALKLDDKDEWMILVILCHYLVNEDDDRIPPRQLERIFSRKSDCHAARQSLKQGEHPLMKKGLIEHFCDNGIPNFSQVHLTGKAKGLLLPQLTRKPTQKTASGLTNSGTLQEKKLIFTKGNTAQVNNVMSLVEKSDEVLPKMKEAGERSGITFLLHGEPGVGKTELVNQIARQTGRDLMSVSPSDIRSKWVGESEKNIKEVFDRYRQKVKSLDKIPILLFNEADGLFGARIAGAQTSTDKMENSLQNIILQEMETLDGILFATTNLIQNLDPAFERRFLFKIRLDKPDAQVRGEILHEMIPELTEEECAELGESYNLSGGQLENVARKWKLHKIIHGDECSRMEILRAFCESETLYTPAHKKRIGF